MARLDQWKLAIFVDPTETPNAEEFRRRVQAIVVATALDIQGEDSTPYTTRQRDKRSQFAAKILSTLIASDVGIAGSLLHVDTVALAIVADETIASTSTDAVIANRLAAVWDDLSDVTNNDLDS